MLIVSLPLLGMMAPSQGRLLDTWPVIWCWFLLRGKGPDPKSAFAAEVRSPMPLGAGAGAAMVVHSRALEMFEAGLTSPSPDWSAASPSSPSFPA